MDIHTGLARRKCLESGTWEHAVDLSDCANVQISNLAEQVRRSCELILNNSLIIVIGGNSTCSC